MNSRTAFSSEFYFLMHVLANKSCIDKKKQHLEIEFWAIDFHCIGLLLLGGFAIRKCVGVVMGFRNSETSWRC